jgi:peptidyl-prolyl cis-trans isomerase SurA
MPKEEIIGTLLDDFIQEKALEYEEQKLAEKYPEFKALMREYEEGILLFEATKINVWDKAAQDTAGLEGYYKRHQKDYMWDERANLVTYTLPAGDEKLLDKVMKLSARHAPGKVVSRINKKETLISYTQKKVEKGSEALGSLPWAKGSRTELVRDEENGKVSFTVIESLLPPAPKKLSEARGYIIADYQDQLEKEWVEFLRKAYDVRVNENVFRSLIRA